MPLNNVPQSGQTLAQTRQPIQTNFQVIDTAFTVNHGPYNTAYAGKHLFIQLPAQVPIGTTGAAEIALYSRNGTTSGVPELFVQKQSLGADAGYAMTEGNLAGNGWCRHSSGLLEKWGITQTDAAGNATVSLNIGGALGPNFTTVFNIIISVASSVVDRVVATQTGFNAGAKTFTVFTFVSTNGAASGFKPFYYRVIGV